MIQALVTFGKVNNTFHTNILNYSDSPRYETSNAAEWLQEALQKSCKSAGLQQPQILAAVESPLTAIRESSFNMTRGGMKILRGGSEKIVALGGGARKICILQNQHDIIIQIRWFSTQQFNDLCNSAISRGLQI